MQWTSSDVLLGTAVLAWLGFVVAILTKSLLITLVTLGLAILFDVAWQLLSNDYDRWGGI